VAYEYKVVAPVARCISQGHRDVGVDASRNCWVVAVEEVRTGNVGNIESQFVHHDLETSVREAEVMLFLVAEESPRASFIEEEVGK
jgi:hypothetical protein